MLGHWPQTSDIFHKTLIDEIRALDIIPVLKVHRQARPAFALCSFSIDFEPMTAEGLLPDMTLNFMC